LQQGERVRGHTTSGGGYGNPLERDPKRVLKDLLDGFETPERASDVYGVIVIGDIASETLSVDVAATADRRRELAHAK
jgi:N-methylhydantoinase B